MGEHNPYRVLLVVALVLGVVVTTAGAFPLTNIVIDDNADGWFTMETISQYGDDLDERGDPAIVFSGHPGYMIGAGEAHLLYDMPRAQYFAVTFAGTPTGDRFFDRLTTSLRRGEAEFVIYEDMTRQTLEQNATATRAFERHYCRVTDPETVALYDETGATLYRYQADCPAERRPEVR